MLSCSGFRLTPHGFQAGFTSHPGIYALPPLANQKTTVNTLQDWSYAVFIESALLLTVFAKAILPPPNHITSISPHMVYRIGKGLCFKAAAESPNTNLS